MNTEAQESGAPTASTMIANDKEKEKDESYILENDINRLIDQQESKQITTLAEGADVNENSGDATMHMVANLESIKNEIAGLSFASAVTTTKSPHSTHTVDVATLKQVNQQTLELEDTLHCLEKRASAAQDGDNNTTTERVHVDSSPGLQIHQDDDDIISIPDPIPSGGGGGRHHQSPTQRGAYYGAPGEALRPAPRFDPSQLPPQERQSVPPLTVVRGGNTQQNSAGDNLVEAQPISQSENFVAGEAEEVTDLEAAQRNSKCRTSDAIKKDQCVWCTALGVLVIAIIVIAVSFTVASSNDNKDEKDGNSSFTDSNATIFQISEGDSTEAPLILFNASDLPDYTLGSLEDPFSVQSKAYDWLYKHPNITNLEPWRRKQMFALATIYYAFDGPNWPLGLNKAWLDTKKHECDWYSNLFGSFGHSGNGAFSYGEKGFVCNERGEYIQLRMASAHDHGYNMTNISFPPEFGLLTAMEDIRLDNNGFFGVATPELFPPSFYQLTNLKEIML